MSVSGPLRHDIGVVPAVAFRNSSPLTAAVPLPSELPPGPYPAAGRRSRRSDRLTADEERLERIPLDERLLEWRGRLARLQARLRDQCPGDHRYVRHRDGKPPWCDSCGYTDVGLHRTENGTGKADPDDVEGD